MFIEKLVSITQGLMQVFEKPEELFEKTISVSEFCKITGYSPSTVYRWLREGKIKGFRCGVYWEIPIYEVLKFIKEPLKITVKGIEVNVEPLIAHELLSFENECLKAGGVVQIRTSMMGYPGYGRNEILLVCYRGSTELSSKYVKVSDEVLKILSILAKGSGYVKEFLDKLWLKTWELIKTKLGK